MTAFELIALLAMATRTRRPMDWRVTLVRFAPPPDLLTGDLDFNLGTSSGQLLRLFCTSDADALSVVQLLERGCPDLVPLARELMEAR